MTCVCVCVCVFQKTMRAECTDTRSPAMAMITVDQLCLLLKFALQRMKCQGVSHYRG